MAQIIRVAPWSVNVFYFLQLDRREEIADMHARAARAHVGHCTELRSVAANTDESTMPSSTFRDWVGLISAVLISGLNQFFGGLVAQFEPYAKCPHGPAMGVEFPDLQGMCSLSAEYLPLRHPAESWAVHH